MEQHYIQEIIVKMFASQRNGVIGIAVMADSGNICLFRNPSTQLRSPVDGEITDAKLMHELLRVARPLRGNVNDNLRMAVQDAIDLLVKAIV